MSKCNKVYRKKRQYCVGDLDTEIKLQSRAITPPVFGSVDFDDNFTDLNPTVWAAVNTVSGKTFFDGVGTETPITHIIGIRFDALVTAETWVELDGRRLDILEVTNLDERSEWMELVCTDRGLNTKNASKA